jgi:hypothetical protein
LATAVNTVEYWFPQYTTNLATATRYDFGSAVAFPVTIPETASRSFLSVILEVTCLDNVTTATSLTAYLLGIKIGAAAFDDTSVTVTVTNSGENSGYMFSRDCTAYFNTNFTGTAHDVQAGVRFTGPSTINHTARLIITYSYDNASENERVKTVRIPLDTTLTELTTTLATVGSSQIPNLDTFLPETTKSYYNIVMVVEGNDSCASTTDFSFCYEIDTGGGEVQDGLHEGALASARWFRRVADLNAMTTNAAHDWRVRVTNTAGGTCNHLSFVLYVTYSFKVSAATSIIHSLALPFCVTPTSTAGAATGDKDRLQLKFYIEDGSSSPTLVQSGVSLHWQNDAASNLSVAAGAQTARAYVDTARVFCGGIAASHRIDSGALAGAGFTIARGENTFTLDMFSSTTGAIRHNSVSGLLLLNYTTALSTEDPLDHTHTVFFGTHYSISSLFLARLETSRFNVPVGDNYKIHYGAIAFANKDTTGINNNAVCEIAAERGSGEGSAAGFQPFDYPQAGYTDLESGICIYHFDASKYFQRHQFDPDTNRMAPATSRSFALKTFKSVCGSMLAVTYHNYKYAVAGTVSGYSGTGSGITVVIHRADTHEPVSAATTSAGGTYSAPWYDNAHNVYAQCRETTGYVGRSDNDTAS